MPARADHRQIRRHVPQAAFRGAQRELSAARGYRGDLGALPGLQREEQHGLPARSLVLKEPGLDPWFVASDAHGVIKSSVVCLDRAREPQHPGHPVREEAATQGELEPRIARQLQSQGDPVALVVTHQSAGHAIDSVRGGQLPGSLSQPGGNDGQADQPCHNQ
jgi:hypothetical protein